CDRMLDDSETCSCAPTPELGLLRGIRRRPAMYWGEVDNLFDSLVAFIAGFHRATAVAHAQVSRLVPSDFHEFVWRRIGSGPMNGHGWTSAIRLTAKSAGEAFELFFTLREEYELERLGHRIPPTDGGVTVLQPHDVDLLLDTLCAQLGFCLAPSDRQRMRINPEPNIVAFTDAVFVAEGLDPTVADRHLYRQVRDLVRAAFDRVQDGCGDTD
ncbi:MAG TPA: hypothetical protein VGC79_29480, partial [Polyangiaceae bacterium]